MHTSVDISDDAAWRRTLTAWSEARPRRPSSLDTLVETQVVCQVEAFLRTTQGVGLADFPGTQLVVAVASTLDALLDEALTPSTAAVGDPTLWAFELLEDLRDAGVAIVPLSNLLPSVPVGRG